MLKELVRTSILSSIFILIILLLKNRQLEKYSHKFNYILSIILMSRMLLIKSISVNIPIHIYKKITTTNVVNNIDFKHMVSNKVNYPSLILMIWLIMSICVLIYYFYRYLSFNYKAKYLIKDVEDNNILGVFHEEKRALGINKNIEIKKLKGISSPALIGFFKATIILPNVDYDNRQLRWVIRHELIHYKRKDNILRLLMAIDLSIYWFNPLVYLLRKYFEEQCELSCDESVLRYSTFSEKKEYAITLLDSIKHGNELSSNIFASQFNNKELNKIKRRVESMLNLKTKKKGIIAGAVLLVIVGASLFSAKAFAEISENYLLDMDKNVNRERVESIDPSYNSKMRELELQMQKDRDAMERGAIVRGAIVVIDEESGSVLSMRSIGNSMDVPSNTLE
ncbi:M56 family metallopeptidase [Clostridium frigidicarnis]|uniref:Signal transducer regulating beta-lactamase production, contains metallopeptidase domain n=1 Tax=Clostridium frigidicarnis TaxID=84698 RepID=A0A1I0Z733_9CLOT|nr:M56 family metallopeptidase [Clostridium frigidicarnis]SFB21414.1 Signal transducer regulating beta-lactamase production, contains metallopeptidase domain [Clostridium frigidicarnis]